MQVTYEQCPWNELHVRQLYRNLQDEVIDENWRPVPGLAGKRVGLYRLYDRLFFQALFADRPNKLFTELQLLIPADTLDDAEWEIAKAGRRYYLSSRFAVTYASQEDPGVLNDLLSLYNLAIVSVDGYWRGEANLVDLRPETLGDAMKRLKFLEAVCMGANQAVQRELDRFWSHTAEQLSMSVVDHQSNNAPLPPGFRDNGPKQRVPLS